MKMKLGFDTYQFRIQLSVKQNTWSKLKSVTELLLDGWTDVDDFFFVCIQGDSENSFDSQLDRVGGAGVNIKIPFILFEENNVC